MENRFKSQLSKLIKSTFNSCRPNNSSDVSDYRSFAGKNPNDRRLIDLFSPKPQPPSSSSSKPNPHLHRRQFPATPLVPATTKTSKKHRKKKIQCQRRRNTATFSSITDNCYYNWWSIEEDDNALFFRGSISPDSFESVRKNRGNTTNAVVMDGFAVAKDSSDPYEDFRVSMVDMIVEKEIFGVEELENLVECFVSLNSEEHHQVIFEVFAEIWETLIADLLNRG